MPDINQRKRLSKLAHQTATLGFATNRRYKLRHVSLPRATHQTQHAERVRAANLNLKGKNKPTVARSRSPRSKRPAKSSVLPIGQKPRLSLYRAKIELDDSGIRQHLDLSKDDKKMYLVITDPRT